MSSINDLRKDGPGFDTGSGTSNSDILEIENPNVTVQEMQKQQRIKKRQIADLSTLPSEENDPEKTGIEIKTSIEDEIFKDDGPFEKARLAKLKEMEEINDLIDAHNEAVATERGEDVPPNEEIENIDMTEVLKGTKFDREAENFGRSTGNFEDPIDEEAKKLSLDSDEEEYIDDMENELMEDDMEDFVEEQAETTESEIKKETKPTLEEQLKSTNTEANSVIKDIAKEVTNPDVGKGVSFDIDEEDFDDIDIEEDVVQKDEKEEEIDEEENMKELQASISDKIIPVNKKFDLSSFTVSKKPTSISSVLNDIKRNSADWVLMSSKVHIAMEAFTGTEVDSLGEGGTNRYSVMRNRYKMIYDHITTKKPDSFDTWVKTTSYMDNQDLYFAIYSALFNGSNYLPYDCPKCSYGFLSDNIPLEEMYKFKDDDAKNKFDKLIASPCAVNNGLYTTEKIQISDKFVIEFRDPSIYSIVFENALLDDKFAEKYSKQLSVLAYIDGIYRINEEEKVLNPINFKTNATDIVKTIKARIITYSKVLNSLSPDQYNVILAYIQAINSNSSEIEYRKPESTCPKCGTKIPETPINAEDLVFLRAPLAALTPTSIK